MRIAILSYPMLFQAQGGLQIQIAESISALKRRSVDAALINPNIDQLVNFDLIHVFSAINGNHRIIEQAKAFGLPAVCSPLIQPHWTTSLGRRSRALETLVGKLTGWEVKTEYRQIASCLSNSDALLALGETEKASIVNAFGIAPDRIRIVPNGIPGRFFAATPDLAHERLASAQAFILCVAKISPHKNQLALARATAASKLKLVIAGECLPAYKAYLDELLAFDHVTYLGKLSYDDPLLPSLYAAARVFCLPSHSEVMPLCVMEALAAGTPAVMTQHHCMDLSTMRAVVTEVSPTDELAIEKAVRAFVAHVPSAEDCRAAVASFTWDSVAEKIHQTYEEVLNRPST
ncbi:MAG: glycosyltransferase family 4 protein [Rhodocyclaceae bacterium]|nr:glycosyltransferase family 4 protein [Rhodocyclaceae bacterium]